MNSLQSTELILPKYKAAPRIELNPIKFLDTKIIQSNGKITSLLCNEI